MFQSSNRKGIMVTAAGTGINLALGVLYAWSIFKVAIKWFPPQKIGRITGIVVAGFGLASVYIAPLTKYSLGVVGLQSTMLILGIAFLIIVCGLSLMLVNPSAGYVPAGIVERRNLSADNTQKRALFDDKEVGPKQVLRSPAFWLLWAIYFIGAGAGLMMVGNIAGMAKSSLGENAFIAVALLAIGNALGRIAAGVMSDRIGRKKTLGFIFVFQAMLMFVAISVTCHAGDTTANAFLLVFLTTLIGFNYGANLTVFPSFTKDMWGIRNFGMNYGLLFTAWGVGGLVMSRVSQYLVVRSGSFRISLMCAGILLLAGACLIMMVKDEKDELRRMLTDTNSKKILAANAA